jgi:leucyl-tRNA synthetase
MKWQKRWLEGRIFEADPDPKREKVFVTVPYPYMNGPLHLGHGFTMTRGDAFARYKRMRGYNVLYPFAFHATGEPIVGAAKRVKAKDEKQIAILKDSGVSDKDMQKFTDPEYIVSYYRKMSTDLASRMGFSLDWRRQFTTIDPQYNKFIEWQYNTLKGKGLVTRGTHPVIYCTKCHSPTGDHDRLEGEGESPEEFTLIKFKFGDSYLVAASLRPETIFGQTNLWVDPEIEYVKARVDGETWIMSEECAEKLSHQLKKVKTVGNIKGKDMIGKRAFAPGVDKELVILPSYFCDPDRGTGIVTSVPSDAPDDWMGLKDLQDSPEECEKYGLDIGEIRKIKPIPIIKTEGMGELPAIDICKKLEVRNQHDREKLGEAKKKVYKLGFHKGMMNDNCGKYTRMPVERAREKVKEKLLGKGLADVMREPTARVVCRCTNVCIVKILENQWFLKYSDNAWKEKAYEALRKMRIYPEDYRAQFENTIDWLHDKACARKSGMGTKVPWGREWIVETLSDSTIYMSFYTIAKHIYKLKIKPDQLTHEFFDYVFLGSGKPAEIAKKTRIEEKLLKEMHSEFEYWYGVDFRNSGKDLLSNHLTFFIFHHVGIWDDEKKWPKGIGVNGFLTVEGEKMSKSKGNFITLDKALDEFGADVTRMNLLYAAEGTQDPDWQFKTARSIGNWLKRFIGYAAKTRKGEKRKLNPIDEWMLSRVQTQVKLATQAYEEAMYRSAIKTSFFDLMNDFRWYKQRNANNSWVEKYVLERIAQLISPVAPHIAEEVWHVLGNKGSVSASPWPEPEEEYVNMEAEIAEGVVKTTFEDIVQIRELVGKKPERIYVYVAPEWKRETYRKASETRNPEQAMKDIMKLPDVRSKGKEGISFAQFLAKHVSDLGECITSKKEMAVLKSAKGYLGAGAETRVELADKASYDPGNKAQKAVPMKPAIYVE